MRQSLICFLVVISCLAVTSVVHGQDSENEYTAKELISDYYDEEFQPFRKGNWYYKLSFSLSDKQLDNVTRLFDKVQEGQDFTYNIRLSGGKYVGQYFALGAGLGYTQSRFTGSLINSDSDTINAQSISRNFNFAPGIRVSMPLTKNQRLSLYNDVGFSFRFGRSLTRDIEKQDEIEQTKGKQFVFGVGLTPGVTFFVMENFAFEIGINVMGYRLNIEDSTFNNEVESRRVEHDVNFRINILSLNLGAAYYIGVLKTTFSDCLRLVRSRRSKCRTRRDGQP